MKIIVKLTFTIICNFIFLVSTNAQEYFQQEVNYEIQARLNDNQHLLNAQMTVEYTNNSSIVLNEIYFHLWANAYSSKSSPFAEQMLRMKQSKFHFADPNEMGGYDEIEFMSNGQKLNWNYEDPSHEIVRIILPNELNKGESIEINIPYKLKIPTSFSRLGHVETSYQMTQWYPKPAVFDNKGWHTMPYLSLGEFYSEFGSFNVTLEIPENYVVAATGELQTESEKAFLNKRIKATNLILKSIDKAQMATQNYPPSSLKFKTINYKASKVHDFAWFADKRFYVQKSNVKLPTNKTIDTWAFFTNDEIKLWKEATNYINDAVAHYSKYVGNYPYPHATAVQSALSAGAGMEYPMITVIGLSKKAESLDNVITHEVGHNWFYGILASNERDNAWMDEGLNTYIENRYMRNKYGENNTRFLPHAIMKRTDINEMDFLYTLKAAINADQASATTSNELGMLNYQISAYSKPGKIFAYLEHFVGTDKFDVAMNHYYEKWKFKHPGPDDIQLAFEESLGADLNWVFGDLLGTKKKVDYAIGSVDTKNGISVEIINRGEISSPILINGLKDDKIIYSEWSEGFEGKRTIHLETEDLDEIVLDDLHITLDVNRENNQTKIKGLFKKTNPLIISSVFGLDHSKKSNYYFLPSMGFNTHDGFMIGLGLHNLKLPSEKFEFYALPMYGFHSKSLVGLGEMRYSWYPNSIFNRIQIGVTGKRFNYNKNINENVENAYTRASSFIDFEFGRSYTKSIVHNIKLSYIALSVESDLYDGQNYNGQQTSTHPFFKTDYTFQNNRIINPYSASVNLEYNDYTQPNNDQSIQYLKLSAGYKGTFNYSKKKSIHLRLFAGTFIMNDRRKMGNDASGQLGRGELGLTYQSYHDNYLFDEYFIGRNKTSGLWSRQILIKEGGFKNALTGTYANQIGQSNDYMTAVNLAIDIPKVPLLQAYFDVAYYGESINSEIENNLVYSGGLAIKIPYLFDIYFPFIHSKDLKDAYLFSGKSKWYQQITFSLNLKQLNVEKIGRSFLYY